MIRPILYSFRRCPYAMRARLAIASAGIEVELREIQLRDKAPELLAASAKATVPVLVMKDGILEESLDIMLWALAQNDPEGWLTQRQAALELINQCDGPFKTALDHTKYASRHPDLDISAERAQAAAFLHQLNDTLADQPFLFGTKPSLADMAILTFVRQFANIDRPWFDAQAWPALILWLDAFLASNHFTSIMQKYPKWQAGDALTLFPS